MRTLASSILSLNWRIILVGTVCFIGIYLLTTDDLSSQTQPLVPINIPQEEPARPAPSIVGDLDYPVDEAFKVGVGKGEEEGEKPPTPDGTFIEPPGPSVVGDLDYPVDEDDKVETGEEEEEKEEEQELPPTPDGTFMVPPSPSKEGQQHNATGGINSAPSRTPSSSSSHSTKTSASPAKGTTAAAAAHKKPAEGYLSICMAIKEQRDDLPEFLIHHYHHFDIRHFYIMDDGSDPPLSEMSDEKLGIPREAVTFEYRDPESRSDFVQMDIYQRCLDQYGSKHTWMAFLDADEFLEQTGNETLTEVLMEMEEDDTVGVLGVNWRMHTSSGLLTRPASARKGFIDCLWDDEENNGIESDNRHVKAIARTSHTLGPSNPHSFNLIEGARSVGEHGDSLDDPSFRMPITRDRLALHHYAVKSLEEYEEKKHRGNAMTQPKTDDFWNHVEGLPHVKCPELASYKP